MSENDWNIQDEGMIERNRISLDFVSAMRGIKDKLAENKMDPTPPDDKFKSYQEEVSKMNKKHFDSLYLGKFPTQQASDDEAETK